MLGLINCLEVTVSCAIFVMFIVDLASKDHGE